MIDIQELKESIDCREYISNFVELKRGVGLCPFHEDNRPSFHVFKNGYKCYACGEYGDVLDFVGAYHGLELGEAIRLLADEHDIQDVKPNKDIEKLRLRDEYFKTIEKEIFRCLCTMMRKLGPETYWTENTYEYERVLSEHIDNYQYVIDARKHMLSRDRKLIRRLNS